MFIYFYYRIIDELEGIYSDNTLFSIDEVAKVLACM